MPQVNSNNIQIHLAVPSDLTAVCQLINPSTSGCEPENPEILQICTPRFRKLKQTLQVRISDRCLLVAKQQHEIIAVIGLELDNGSISELCIPFKLAKSNLLRKLVDSIERLAVQFGLTDTCITVPNDTMRLFEALAYQPAFEPVHKPDSRKTTASVELIRSLARRQTHYSRLVARINDELGIAANYGQVHRLALQKEPSRLKSIGPDLYRRDQKMTPAAAKAWLKMKNAAKSDGVNLQVVSAFRSVQYQKELLERKLNKGQRIEHILKVSAAPGFSEHHTGRAIDITTPGFAVLEQEFEQSPAFRWLQSNASQHSFNLSFPRDNRHQVSFEPWHWCYKTRLN